MEKVGGKIQGKFPSSCFPFSLRSALFGPHIISRKTNFVITRFRFNTMHPELYDCTCSSHYFCLKHIHQHLLWRKQLQGQSKSHKLQRFPLNTTCYCKLPIKHRLGIRHKCIFRAAFHSEYSEIIVFLK
jgi:hypothetical protein